MFPDAGLEDGRYCRNPLPDLDTKPWCFTDDPNNDAGWEYCEVPYCIAPPTSCDSSEESTKMSDAMQAACSYHQCASNNGESSSSDYITDDISFVAPYPSEVQNDCLCSYEMWDCESGSQACFYSKKADAVYECCASKLVSGVGEEGSNSTNTTNTTNITNNFLEASCECLIKRDCEQGDLEKCIEFSESCCRDDDKE